MFRAFTVAALAFAISSCGGNARPSAARSSSTLLTQKEIAAAPVTTAYDALERLRPTFLRPNPRSTTTHGAEYAVVFIDGVRRGSPEILRTVAAGTVVEIRYITAADATTRYGMNVEGGVLDVKLIHP